jgi:hypothetical protein
MSATGTDTLSCAVPQCPHAHHTRYVCLGEVLVECGSEWRTVDMLSYILSLCVLYGV